MANVTVTLQIVDQAAAPIDSVLIRVFQGGAFVTSGSTDAGGEVEFSLPASAEGVLYDILPYKEGVSFLSGLDFLAQEGEVNVFSYPGHVGMLGALVRFVVQDDSGDPVSGVKIFLFESPADSFLTELETDTSGEAELVLEGAASPGKEYIVRTQPPSGYSSEGTRVVSVIDPLGIGETNIFDLSVSAPAAIPETTDPDMCRVSGHFTDPSLRPLKNVTLTFHPREGYPDKVIAGAPYSGQPTIVRNNIVGSARRVTTDKNGYVEIDLPRGAIFDVFADFLAAADHRLFAAIYIPDRAGISIHEVLFPYVTKVTYASDSVILAAGESLDLEVAIEASNYQPIAGKASITALLSFSVSDSEKAKVSLTDDGKLRVTALAAGTADLLVERITGTYAPRRPEIGALIVDPSTPTITVT